MEKTAPSLSRMKLILPGMAVALGVASILVGLVLAMNYWGRIPIGNLTRDPAALSGTPSYTGFLSQVGLFLWSAAAAICLFGATLLRGQHGTQELRHFLFASGFLTLLLGLDDAFLLHEEILPGSGIPEKMVLAAYVGLTSVYLFRFRQPILRTGWELLALAFLFFGSSVLLDLLNPPGVPFIFEDGTKIAGIVSWLSYFSCTASLALARSLRQPEPNPKKIPGVSLPVTRMAGTFPARGAVDAPLSPLPLKPAARRARGRVSSATPTTF